MSLTTSINKHSDGPQNVTTGDGSQYNNNASGPQFINSNFYGVDPKDTKVAEMERLLKEKEDCLRSLGYQNLNARNQDISPAHPETCNWFFETAQFKQWFSRDELASHNGVLWVKGKPGAGKSTLMKHTLKHCQRVLEKHIIIAHFFNARGDNFEKSRIGMLRSLLYQLLDKEPSIYERFVPIFREKCRNGSEWREPELQDFLLLEMQNSHSKPVLLLVDALDECSELHVRGVVKFLEELSHKAIEANMILNICLSSRHYPHISMKRSLELVVEVTAEHDEDIIKYAGDKLTKRDGEIEREVCNKASGVFMWVVLVVEMLNKAYDEGKIDAMHQKLHSVPSDLEEVFEILLNKDNPDKQETIFMLQCVLFTRRLLQPEELYFAMMAETKPEKPVTWNRSEMTPDDIQRRITHSSRGLIEIRRSSQFGEEDGEETGTVQFIHESVNDFLIRNERLQRLDPVLELHPIGSSHERLRSCCLSYIMNIFQSSEARAQFGDIIHLGKDWWKAKDFVFSYPFGGYASTYIFEHAEEADRRGIRQAKFLQCLEDESDTFERVGLLQKNYSSSGNSCAIGASLLYMVAYHGYNRLVMGLLEKGANINARGGLCGTALHAAIVNGQDEIITTLLKGGANISTGGGYYGTALQTAIIGNEGGDIPKRIMNLLLEKGADIDAQGGVYGTALQAAAARGRQEHVKLLLEKGANIDAQGGIYGTALQAAAANGKDKVVKLLLKEGANVNIQGGLFGTALQAVTGKLHRAKIRELLIEEGANINTQKTVSGPPFPTTRVEGDKDGIKTLLKEGLNTSAQIIAYIALPKGMPMNEQEIIAVLLGKKKRAHEEEVIDTTLSDPLLNDLETTHDSLKLILERHGWINRLWVSYPLETGGRGLYVVFYNENASINSQNSYIKRKKILQAFIILLTSLFSILFMLK